MRKPIMVAAYKGGAGGGSPISQLILTKSHIAATRPFIVLLATQNQSTDAARRLHIHTFSDPAV